MATLTAYISRTKHYLHNWASALTTTRGVNMLWTLVHKRLQTGPSFLPTLSKFCFVCHCQTVDCKSRTIFYISSM